MEPSAAARATSADMRTLGILQRGDHRLERRARPFRLPRDRDAVRALTEHLLTAATRIRAAHHFRAGMGLAAPQLGIPRRLAVVHPPDGEPPIILLNPQVHAVGPAGPAHFEGCLSFFDVRGRVARPSTLRVILFDVEGQQHHRTFEGHVAALVAHEIDHLDGTLYPSRMEPEEGLVPVAEYLRLRATQGT